MYCLFVDDERLPPEDGNKWEIARTFHEAICLLEVNTYLHVSLDHDIQGFYGNREMTGNDILMWMIDQKLNHGRFQFTTVVVHSQNCAKAPNMEEDCKRYFSAV